MDEIFHLGREPLDELAEARGLVVQDGPQDAPRVVPLVGRTARDHPIGRGAEGVDVGPRVRRRSARQLGRQEVRRSEHLATLSVHVGLLHLNGEAEVGDLRGAVRVAHQVVGLDVPVDDPAGLGVDEASSGVAEDPEGFAPVEATLRGEMSFDGASIHELHGQEVLASVLPDVVHRDDVRVIELGGGAGLLAEAIDEGRVAGELRRQHLDGDLAVEARLGGAEDAAHRAATQLPLDAVAGDPHGGAPRGVGSGRFPGNGSGLARSGDGRVALGEGLRDDPELPGADQELVPRLQSRGLDAFAVQQRAEVRAEILQGPAAGLQATDGAVNLRDPLARHHEVGALLRASDDQLALARELGRGPGGVGAARTVEQGQEQRAVGRSGHRRCWSSKPSKSAEPTRTWVAPLRMAASRSPLIPMES